GWNKGMISYTWLLAHHYFNHQYATGAANTIESTTSRTPPKPGTACEASLRRQSRLMSDSARSPSMPATPRASPNPAADRTPPRTAGPSRSRPTAATTAATRPPAAPSHVFLGL